MKSVVVERAFDQPRSVDDLHAIAHQLRWCTDLYRVAASPWRYLAVDGRRCACIYTAPDLEAIRQVLRKSQSGPPRSLWATTTHAGPADGERLAPGFSLVLVERFFAAPARWEEFRALQAGHADCFDLHRVRLVRSHLACDGHRMLCVFAAPDLEAVRLANRKAGLPCDAVWAATLVPPLVRPEPESLAIAV